MNAKDRIRLKAVAERMIREAQSVQSDRIFSAAGFARENISIVHQQLRCVNLAWALSHTKQINPGDVVAIVGGSFSGLMLACSLAIANDVIVYIFEKEERLLHRFLDKSHRHLSPNLNSRDLGDGFSPTLSSAFFDPPIFKWREAAANEVAAHWLREFEAYRDKLPIFSFLGLRIDKRSIKQNGRGIRIVIRSCNTRHFQPIDVDILIDATGFGEEGNPHGLVDYSYWEAGHRLIYDHLPRKCKIMISGCGDSGLVEAMHYAIADFKHEHVERFWPHGVFLDLHLDQRLEWAKMTNIFSPHEEDEYNGRIIPEIRWWLNTWFAFINWKDDGWTLDPGEAPLFRAIDEELRTHLLDAFPDRKPECLHAKEREKFVSRLPLKVQLEVRKAVQSLADECISRRMAAVLDGIAVPKLLRMRTLHQMARPTVKITLNATTPTPYTRALSPYNAWLMRVLMTFPNVRYRQGKVRAIERYADGHYRVTFHDGKRESYDRVVTRYGPSKEVNIKSLSSARFRDPHPGNWLLSRVTYLAETEDPNVRKTIEPAVDQITRKVDQVLGRRGSTPSSPLDKRFYRERLLIGPIKGLKYPPLYVDPQRRLTRRLRMGLRPTYVENSLLQSRRGRT